MLDGPIETAEEAYAVSRDALRDALSDTRAEALAPSPRMSVSEWAEANFRLSPESSAEPGPLRLYGFQKGPLDAMGDPRLWGVAVMKSARVGYTMSLKAAAAYYTEHDPTSALVVMPTEDDARDFVKTEIEPMIRDTPALAAIVGGGTSQNEWHTKFTSRGSVLRVRGAYSPDAFRRITSRANFGDEIDGGGWDNGAKSQGDKIRLLRKRGETYWNSRLILGSTPTIAGLSRIESWYLRGDQRRYFVPCPHCGEFQTLEWGGRNDPHGVKWPQGRPHEAYYVCRESGCIIEEKDKPWMDERGEWRTTAEGEPGLASYHINALYSLFPSASWGNLAAEFVDAAKDPEKLRTFVNLVLGEPWQEEVSKSVGTHELLERIEVYQAEVPAGARILTAGVDVQSADGGRFEVSVYAWGAGEECWLVGHWILRDYPLADPRAWETLESLLLRAFQGEDGRDHRIQAAAIDSGGHYTQETYSWTRKHASRRWWAIKSRSNAKGERSATIWPRDPSKTKNGSLLHVIDADIAKDTLSRRLALGEGEPGQLHWPSAPISGAEPVDATFFERLTREKARPAPGRLGKVFWTSPSDQEPWDCLVYAYAATHGLRAYKGGKRLAEMLASRRQDSSEDMNAAGDDNADPQAGEVSDSATDRRPENSRPNPPRRRKNRGRTQGSFMSR